MTHYVISGMHELTVKHILIECSFVNHIIMLLI